MMAESSPEILMSNCNYLWRIESYNRIIERLLPKEIWSRHAFGALPWYHLVRNASRGWNNRLRRGHLLLGS